MSTKNNIYKHWSTVVNEFDKLCVHTIFSTKVLAISRVKKHGTRCGGLVHIITRDGRGIAHYPGKSIIEDFETVNTKITLLCDLLCKLNKKGDNSKVKIPVLDNRFSNWDNVAYTA